MAKDVDDGTSDMHLEASFHFLDRDKMSVMASYCSHHLCVQYCGALSSIAHQHLLEKCDSQSLRKVTGWF